MLSSLRATTNNASRASIRIALVNLIRGRQFTLISLPKKDLNFRGDTRFPGWIEPGGAGSLNQGQIERLNRKSPRTGERPGDHISPLREHREESSKAMP